MTYPEVFTNVHRVAVTADTNVKGVEATVEERISLKVKCGNQNVNVTLTSYHTTCTLMLQGSKKKYSALGSVTPAAYVAKFIEEVGKHITQAIDLKPIVEVMKKKILEWGNVNQQTVNSNHDSNVRKSDRNKQVAKCNGRCQNNIREAPFGVCNHCGLSEHYSCAKLTQYKDSYESGVIKFYCTECSLSIHDLTAALPQLPAPKQSPQMTAALLQLPAPEQNPQNIASPSRIVNETNNRVAIEVEAQVNDQTVVSNDDLESDLEDNLDLEDLDSDDDDSEIVSLTLSEEVQIGNNTAGKEKSDKTTDKKQVELQAKILEMENEIRSI